MDSLVIKDANIVNEGSIIEGDVLIKNGRFEQIGSVSNGGHHPEIHFDGDYLIPGIIDDQVHFRQPGLTHKADIRTESMAAAAGGVTTFMEMPNTIPPATSIELLEEKYQIAERDSIVNYSFYLGATNDNLDEIMKADYSTICGLKIFMGSSTGNLLVDNEAALDQIFKNAPALIATHCEDESTIQNNLSLFKEKYGNNLNASHHPLIRSAQGCYISSSKAIDLAKKHQTRLHILHISTEIETALFENNIPLAEKMITAEACVHHLYFCDQDYSELGNKIKCNPAIKSSKDRQAIIEALKSGKIDVVATDHAPHTLEEKNQPYLQAPSGLPLVQHSINIMLDFVKKGIFSLEEVINWMCHAPAVCFKIKERGYIRPGYHADFARLNFYEDNTISDESLFYKCRWSPLSGKTLPGNIISTWAHGTLVYNEGLILTNAGQRLKFAN